MRVCWVLILISATTCVGQAQDSVRDGDRLREPYVLDWWSIDGGGGVTSGGNYELTSVIGQPDVGVIFGEDYLLKGGFLSGGDIGILFVDGFESGSSYRWDGTVGAPLW